MKHVARAALVGLIFATAYQNPVNAVGVPSDYASPPAAPETQQPAAGPATEAPVPVGHEMCPGDNPAPAYAPAPTPAKNTPAPAPAPTRGQYGASSYAGAKPAAATSSTAAASSPMIGSMTRADQFTLEQTNIIRRHHGLQPVQWDETLAQKVRAMTKVNRGYRHFQVPGTWQNMAGGSPCKSQEDTSSTCKVDPTSAAWRWYENEEPLWDYSKRACRGKWEKCGHFVIMTQPSTTKIGCAWTFHGTGYPMTNYYCNYEGTSAKDPVIPNPGTNHIKSLKAALDKHSDDYCSKY